MLRENNLPEEVYCQICGNGRGFHNLSAHLVHVHGTTLSQYRQEFGIPDNVILFSRHFSRILSERAKNPANLARIRILNLEGKRLLRETMRAIEETGLLTTRQAAKLRNASLGTINDLIVTGKLTAGQICPIASVEVDSDYKTVALPLPPTYLIDKYDLEGFKTLPAREIHTLALRQQSIQGLAEQGFYTTGQAAKMIGYTPGAVWKLIKNGRLEASLASPVNPFTTLNRMGVSRPVYLIAGEDLSAFRISSDNFLPRH